MIKVNYTELDGPYGPAMRLEAAGHAGYAPAGQDIVCAGVSTLMQALVSLLAMALGPLWINPLDLQAPSALQQLVLFELRWPRLLLGLVVGASLAVAGFVLQSLTRVSIAAPSVLGLADGAGLSVVLVLFAAMRERIAIADVPKSFQGAAIGMITAGLMSLAFMGFSGLNFN